MRRTGRGRWPEPMREPLRLGIAGLGTVGSAVLSLIAQNGMLADLIACIASVDPIMGGVDR